MRRLVAVSIVTGVMVLSSFSLVTGQADPVTPPTQVRTTPGTLTNMIDNIDVPWEILEYIQMKYEGHAVTKADKIRRGNSELYRLRVDRDDQINDYDSIAVLFDMKWRLVGEEKYASPPPKPKEETPKPEEQKPVEETEKPKKPDTKPANNVDAQDEDEGGMGGGEETTEDTETNTEPTSESPRQRR